MTCNPKVKDPAAKLDYGFDWGDGYLDAGSPPETIITSTWEIEPAQGSPAEIEVISGSETISTDLTQTAATVEGGVLGSRYELVNEIVTSLGRRDRRRTEIRIANT